jgi:hypothetical protein
MRYLNSCSALKKEDVIPLAFDSYGGYASVTYKLLRRKIISISDNDFKLADRLVHDLRNEIATAIHSGLDELINYLNSRNAVKRR